MRILASTHGMRAACLLLALGACGGNTQSPESAASELLETQSGATVSVPLTYTVQEAGKQREIHTPMIEARVGQQKVLFILDTGATDPIFTMDLANRIGASTTRVEDGTDHAGASVPTFAGQEPLRFSFGGFEQVVEEPLYIEGPPPFEGWNVCGILSPQLLGLDAWIELDFSANVLRLHKDEKNSVLTQVNDRLGVDVVRLPRVPADGDEARLLIVEGSLAGSDEGSENTPLRLMLNTGGRHTEIDPKVAQVQSANSTKTGRGVSGKAVEGAFSESVMSILLGRSSIKVPKSVLRPQSPAYDGQLGIEAFKGAVVVFRSEPNFPVYWWPPVANSTP